MINSLRTTNALGFAEEANSIPLIDDLNKIRSFSFWDIIDNPFPYDNIFQTHHLLVPHRRAPSFEELGRWVQTELRWIIVNYCEERYDVVFENMPNARQFLDSYATYHVNLAIYPDKLVGR